MPKTEFNFPCGSSHMRYSRKSSAPRDNGSFETGASILDSNKKEGKKKKSEMREGKLYNREQTTPPKLLCIGSVAWI